MTYMFILKCALKLVEEIILYYDARSKKHQIIYNHLPNLMSGLRMSGATLLLHPYAFILFRETNSPFYSEVKPEDFLCNSILLLSLRNVHQL